MNSMRMVRLDSTKNKEELGDADNEENQEKDKRRTSGTSKQQTQCHC